ncbi:uncharacterized protein TNCV_1816891 [Trichonephila clavipes]|nr:uncharacterized protein TNCV_1816891 [Trichonephila clavipes]
MSPGRCNKGLTTPRHAEYQIINLILGNIAPLIKQCPPFRKTFGRGLTGCNSSAKHIPHMLYWIQVRASTKVFKKRRGVFNKGRCNKSNDGYGESNSTVPKNSADGKNCADGAKLCTNETEPSASNDENDGKRDLAVAVDGSWQKRGFSSKNGLVTVTSVDTGKVIDVEVFSKHCICPNKTNHLQNCKRNFEGYSGKMEVAGALSIFQRSQSLYNVRYTKYLGDGDSKTFTSIVENKVYGDHCSVEKLECIGHVMKRMGTRLRRLKTKMRGHKNFLTERLYAEEID